MFHPAPVITLFFFSTLGSDASSLPSLASSQSTWGTLRQSLKSLSVEFAVLSDKAAQQVRPSVLHPHHLLSKSRHRVVNVVVLMSSGPTGRGRCCGKTESFPGFAAVVQSESVTPFEFFLSPPFRGQQPFMTGDLVLLFACFHVQGLMSL